MSRSKDSDDDLDALDPAVGADTAGPAAEGTPPDELAELKDKWLRALAEVENVRRAGRQENEQVRRFGATALLQGLLGVLDNLQRALAAPPPDLERDFHAGLQLIERQFLDVLTAHGVTPVPAGKGQRFDPTVHHAILEQESDEVEPGAILTTVAPGYRLHDRLLREAQVVVARAPSRAAS